MVAGQRPTAYSLGRTPRVWIGEDDGQTALLIDGVVQSVVVDRYPLGPGYWPLMLPEVCPERALILGMGGGTIAHLLMHQFGPVPIIGVEIRLDVIRLATSAFELDHPSIQIVEADAFVFVHETVGPYDYIAVDLFADGGIPRGIFARPFLRQIKQLLSPRGLAAINFFIDRRTDDHLHRIRQVFPRVAVVESRKNVVARCRPR
ncbi:MAG: hypothetical protein GEU73_08440 [Chloroflexi bacterium]|nr:hypothetical protein [Chloroflexota bacterium]